MFLTSKTHYTHSGGACVIFSGRTSTTSAWRRGHGSAVNLMFCHYLVVAEAVSQDQSQRRVEDADSTEDRLQPTGTAHHTEQNCIPLNYTSGLQTHSGPHRPVVQIPCMSEGQRQRDKETERQRDVSQQSQYPLMCVSVFVCFVCSFVCVCVCAHAHSCVVCVFFHPVYWSSC